jgi:TatD DNase family protein
MKTFKMRIVDIHTHNVNAENALISVAPDMLPLHSTNCYSVGLHPWDTVSVTDSDLETLKTTAIQNNVYAIGECGIDKLRGASLEIQKKIFENHIRLSEDLCKPLIIHQVKSIDEIFFYRKKYSPSQRWLIHGFRGNIITAKQLLKVGIEFSLGSKFVADILQIIPMKSLFLESDDSSCFPSLLRNVAHLLSRSVQDLEQQLVENNRSFLNL